MVASTPTSLLKKTTKFELIERCKRAIKELSQHLTSTSILSSPVESKEFIIYNDASKDDLGCVLV